MKKSTPPPTQPLGNAQKYLSYREAWTRIKEAQENGFYLEAVAIEESIITDRLISHFVKVGVLERAPAKPKHLSFGQLIQLWRKHVPDPIKQCEFDHLQEAVDGWRGSRNRSVHGMVKSQPGDPTEDVVDFLTAAREAAELGARLAHAVGSWHQRMHRIYPPRPKRSRSQPLKSPSDET